MPKFRYTAFSSDGLRENGVLDVSTEAQAWDKLTALGLTVVELLQDDGRAQPPPWSALQLGRRIPLSAQADLADQLAVLFSARLTAMQVVETVTAGASSPNVRRMFRRVSQLMADGQRFPDALSDAGDGLQSLFVDLARIGQASGDLAPLMRSLATSLRRQEKMSAQIKGALVYPVILLSGGIGILVLMALYLAPQLASIFNSVERPLPTELAVFIRVGEILQSWWLAILVLSGTTIILPSLLLTRYRAGAKAFLHRLPVVGPVARDASLARLSRSVQIMLAAGLPLAPTLRAAAVASSDDPLSQHFLRAAEQIEAGGHGAEIFAVQPALTPTFRELFAIGERTNALPLVMESVATALEDQAERRAQQAMTLLTPLLTLLIGGAIALLVSSVMGALLAVNDVAL
jgi:general secretion pathway protein F